MSVTLFEQIFCAKQAKKCSTGVLRPPSSKSARVAANRITSYNQIPVKLDIETQHIMDEARLAEIADMNNRLRKLEDDISTVKDLLQELVTKL